MADIIVVAQMPESSDIQPQSLYIPVQGQDIPPLISPPTRVDD